MSKTIKLGLALALGLSPLALSAEDAAKAAPAAETAAAAPAEVAKPAATPVAKNDAPGSITPGNRLIDEGKYAEAVAYFEGIGEQVAANGTKKREPWRLVGLSSAYIGTGDFAKAAEAAQKAIDIDATISAAWNNLGAAQAQAGKREEAIATFEKAIEAFKAAGKDTSKFEGNLTPLKAALEEAKMKAETKVTKAGGAVKAAAVEAVKPAIEAAKPAIEAVKEAAPAAK